MFKVGPGFCPVLPFRGRGCGRRTAGRSACPRLRSGCSCCLRAVFQKNILCLYPLLSILASDGAVGKGLVPKLAENWGQRWLFSWGWGYYPTIPGKVHKSLAAASTVAHRGFLGVGSAARNARDAKIRGRFSASLAALPSLARHTAPLQAAVHCSGSYGSSVPTPGVSLSSGSSAV